jgi:hypothetical protein
MLKTYDNWARYHKDSGSGAGDSSRPRLMLDTIKTALKVVFAQSAKPE